MELKFNPQAPQSKQNLRLKSAESRLQSQSPSHILDLTHRRLDSANAIRLSHQNSFHVMPRRRGDEFALTSYRVFHDWKKSSVANSANLLPSSPTRRNNPHPNLSFLQWQLVSHAHQERPKIPPTNLLQSNKIINEVKPPVEREMFDHEDTCFPYLSSSLKGSFKEYNISIVKQWLINASSKEKLIIMNMLKTKESKDIRIRTACRDVLNPEVVESVEKWLITATEEEKNIALRVFEGLANSSSAKPSSNLSNRHRSKSFSHSSIDLHLPSHYGTYRNLPFYDIHQDNCLRDRDREKCLLWHHQSRRDQVPNVFHRGSLFNVAQRSKGQHWTIHPEWPTA